MDRKTPKDNSKKQLAQQPASKPGKFLDDVSKCIDVLKAGGIIIYPTDTSWGMGCDATNENAVKKLLELIQSDEPSNLVVLVEHPDRLGRHVRQIPEAAIQLIEVNDKPMTILYPGAVNLAKDILSPDGSAGIRITSDEFCIKLISSLNRPVAFTSNISDDEEPETFRDISDSLKQKVDYVVKWRQNDPQHAVHSSVIKVGLRGEIEIITT